MNCPTCAKDAWVRRNAVLHLHAQLVSERELQPALEKLRPGPRPGGGHRTKEEIQQLKDRSLARMKHLTSLIQEIGGMRP